MLNVNQIYQGDCLELMHDIPDGSVDMILADLPYGTTACAWDSIIPLEPLWAHYKRIIKPRGAIVLTASQPFTSKLVMSNLDWFKYEWIWEKDNGSNFLLANKQPFKVHENILFFCNGQSNYYPQMKDGEPYRVISGTAHRAILGENAHVADNTLTVNKGNRYPRSVQKFNYDRGLHPTQKPVALFAYLIRTYTNPGELVLDNTIGSGTTAIAAIDTGRDWIGIEQDPGYFEVANNRIAERLKQPALPGIEPAKSVAYTQQLMEVLSG